MLKLKGALGLLAVGMLISMSPLAMAHGDVTPHPIDTSSLKQLGSTWADANPYRGDKQAAAVGAEGYMHNCAGCHGLNVITGGVAPDLLKLDADCLDMDAKEQQEACLKDTDAYFKEVTLSGKKNSEGRYTMPAYSAVFTQEAVWALKAYVDARTHEELHK